MTSLSNKILLDAQRRPLLVYHGTSSQFDVFAANERGIFFAEDRAQALPFSRIRRGTPRVIAAHLSIRNPWTMVRYADDVPFSRMIDQSVTALRARGYDAMRDPQDKVWIVFDPAQVIVQDHHHVEQTLLVSTRNRTGTSFKQWFGQSQVVDAHGQPLRVYHGTRRTDEQGEAISTFNVGRGDLGQGIYFASDPTDADDYANSWGDPGRGGMLMPVYLSLQNPYFWTPEDRHKDADTVNLQARLAGHDGIIRTWTQSAHRHFIVFHPSQLKSATGNCGDFDLDNDDIRFSLVSPDDLSTIESDLPLPGTGY